MRTPLVKVLVAYAAFFSSIALANPSQASTGWYLLAPEVALGARDGISIENNRPLHTWKTLSSYDSAALCEAARSSLRRKAHDSLAGTQKAPDSAFPPNDRDIIEKIAALDVARATYSVCIASDDARLKDR